MPDKQKRVEDAIDRAVSIAGRIAARQDLDVRRRIVAFDEKLDGVQKLGIAEDALRQIQDAEIETRLVFAHPQVLQAIPEASLYYRGIALLSRKRVQEIVGGIDTWETSPPTARVTCKDPAGALERLGAVKKTFDEAPPGCRNFLVVGVVTPTMRERLDEMRMERDFNIDDLLDDEAVWLDFMNEVFHHSLRITPEVRPP